MGEFVPDVRTEVGERAIAMSFAVETLEFESCLQIMTNIQAGEHTHTHTHVLACASVTGFFFSPRRALTPCCTCTCSGEEHQRTPPVSSPTIRDSCGFWGRWPTWWRNGSTQTSVERTKVWRQKTTLEPCSAVNSNADNVGNIFCLRQPTPAQWSGLTVYVWCNYNNPPRKQTNKTNKQTNKNNNQKKQQKNNRLSEFCEIWRHTYMLWRRGMLCVFRQFVSDLKLKLRGSPNVGWESSVCSRFPTMYLYCHTLRGNVTRQSGSCTPTSEISLMESAMPWRLL